LIKFIDYNVFEQFNLFQIIVTINNDIAKKYKDETYKNEFDKFTENFQINRVCNFKNTRIKLPYYGGSQDLNLEFIPEIYKTFDRFVKKLLPNDILIMIEFKLNAVGDIDMINITSNKIIQEEKINQIKSIVKAICKDKLTPASIIEGSKKFDCNFFIPILYKSGEIITPRYIMELPVEDNEALEYLKR